MALKAILLGYIFNNIELNNLQLFTNLNNIINDLISGTKSLSNWQIIIDGGEGFTNYSTGIDYSKISVNNRPYSIKQKLTGSPIFF